MTGPVYYNDNDPAACAWLRELIAAGELPQGDVDERSIVDVRPADLAGYRQHHFFAGIGGWPLALRWAGLEDEPGIVTASCPCQPLSCAGKRQAERDERHLWPILRSLIAECRPAAVFGEQVASALGREWFAGVRLDLEALGYACGGADLCAAGVGAPHRRQRLFWVAEAGWSTGRYGAGRLADTKCQRGRCWEPRNEDASNARQPSEARGMADLLGSGLEGHAILPCRDGKARRVEAGTFPLADGIPGRMGLLRGYGNAIVPQVAAEFLMAWMECRPSTGQRR